MASSAAEKHGCHRGGERGRGVTREGPKTRAKRLKEEKLLMCELTRVHPKGPQQQH